jgi:FAD dependent oxidoreductase
MEKVNEAARSVDVALEADVLVVGSGPGGLAAALAAARAGARTTLIDRNGCFGGNITQVGVEGFAWYRHEQTIDCEGIGIEFEQRQGHGRRHARAAVAEPCARCRDVQVGGGRAGRGSRRHAVAASFVRRANPGERRHLRRHHREQGRARGDPRQARDRRDRGRRHRCAGRGARAQVAEGGDDGRVGHVLHERRQQAQIHRRGESDPQTYADWSGNGEWDYETTGKEDKLFSPFLRKPFKQALAAGVIPPNLHTIAGTWGTVTDQGDLTYLNLVHIPQIDGTDPNDLTIGEMRGRREAIHAVAALRGFMPGCEDAKLRNFGMTLGIRDTRKIDALYNLTGTDVREQARFDDAIGIFPEFIDGFGVLILPTTGRYWHVPYRALVPKGVGNLLVAGRCIGGDKISHASARNMMCCAVSGQGAGVAAAVSLKRDEAFDRLNIGAVQKELARQGARFQ